MNGKFVVAFGSALALSTPAAAGDLLTARDRTWFGTLAGGQWVDSRLPEFPYNLVTGGLVFRDAYFVSGAVSRVIVPDFAIPLPFTGSRLAGNSLEAEAQLTQHFGLEHMTEATLAVALRSGEIPLWEGLHFNVGWANGLSYAFDHPDFEVGRGGVRGVDSVKLQYYMGIDSEWTAEAAPRVHFLTQLHHRSGIYGIVSPQRTGSNYIGAGLRFDFE